jgi:hypothetical protein
MQVELQFCFDKNYSFKKSLYKIELKNIFLGARATYIYTILDKLARLMWHTLREREKIVQKCP